MGLTFLGLMLRVRSYFWALSCEICSLELSLLVVLIYHYNFESSVFRTYALCQGKRSLRALCFGFYEFGTYCWVLRLGICGLGPNI